jgi:hypothetical protein
MKRPSLDSPPVKCYKLYAIVYAGDWRHEAREVFRHGDYPLGNRLYHFVIVLAAVAVVVTGLFMMVRVRTPFVGRILICSAMRHGGSRTSPTAPPVSPW